MNVVARAPKRQETQHRGARESGHTLPLCLPPPPPPTSRTSSVQQLFPRSPPGGILSPGWTHRARAGCPPASLAPAGLGLPGSGKLLCVLCTRRARPRLCQLPLSRPGCFPRALPESPSSRGRSRPSTGPGRSSTSPANSPARLHPKTRVTGRLVGPPTVYGFLLCCDQNH